MYVSDNTKLSNENILINMGLRLREANMHIQLSTNKISNFAIGHKVLQQLQ